MSRVAQNSAPSKKAPRATQPKATTKPARPQRRACRALDAHCGKAAAAPVLKPGQHFTITRDWQRGEVAFLKPSQAHFKGAMSREEAAALVHSGYIPRSATHHPVLILERGGPLHTHALVTTISAYGSGDNNNWKAPWEQPLYRDWDHMDWVSVKGSQECRVPGRTPETFALRLENGRRMNKPMGSWLNVQCAWVVPLTVLNEFGDYRREPIRVVPEDMEALSKYIRARSENYHRCWLDPRLRHVNHDPARGNGSRGNGPPTAPAAVAPAVKAAPAAKAVTAVPAVPAVPAVTFAAVAAAPTATVPAWSTGDWKRNTAHWRRNEKSASGSGN